jgi:hypothetical protein
MVSSQQIRGRAPSRIPPTSPVRCRVALPEVDLLVPRARVEQLKTSQPPRQPKKFCSIVWSLAFPSRDFTSAVKDSDRELEPYYLIAID